MSGALAFPVCGFVGGAALGLVWPDVPLSLLVAVVGGWLVLGAHSARVGRMRAVAACAAGLFMVVGLVMSADAWHRAWRPSLRLVWEAAARDVRRDATRAGRVLPEDDVVPMVVVGVLRSDASMGATGSGSLSVDTEWIGRAHGEGRRGDAATNPVEGGVALSVAGTMVGEQVGEWRAGRRVRLTADLRRPARYLNPGVPDQERALARRGVSLVGTVKSAALVDVLDTGSTVDELTARIRSYTRSAIAASVGLWSPRAAGIVTAIVIGDRTGLDADVERQLQESGTYHVIAISGGNIAILAGLTLAMFRIVGLLGRVAMLSAAAGLVAYGRIVGGGASVDRAVLMAVVYFVGRAWDLRGPPYQSLLLAALVLAWRDPLSVADPASLLTFGATAAIVSTARLSAAVAMPAWLRPAAAMLLASASTEVLLLPVSAMLFSRITFAGLALNFGAIPLMAVAQLAGMAVVPLFAVSPVAARLLGWLAFIGAEGLVKTAGLVAVVPWSTWRVPPPSVLVVGGYYAALVSAWWLWRQSLTTADTSRNQAMRVTRVCLTCGAAGAAFWIVASPRLVADSGDARLHVTFIDVGQGDAALVRFPGGASALIDAGGLGGAGAFDVGDRVVAPVLRHLGVRRLATLALTHGDADHIGGAMSVLQEFKPWDVWDGVPVPPFEPMSRLRLAAQSAGARWTTLQRGDGALVNDVQIEVHHPPLPDWERQRVRNDDSIVLELRWKDVSFVFTGDVGREPEAEIASRFRPAPLRVVKVPHHGSLTSSSVGFVNRLSADVGVVSVGRSNTFGHPAAAVLARYAAQGTRMFRTDRDGAVMIESDGHSIDVHTFAGRTLHLTPSLHSVSRSDTVE